MKKIIQFPNALNRALGLTLVGLSLFLGACSRNKDSGFLEFSLNGKIIHQDMIYFSTYPDPSLGSWKGVLMSMAGTRTWKNPSPGGPTRGAAPVFLEFDVPAESVSSLKDLLNKKLSLFGEMALGRRLRADALIEVDPNREPVPDDLILTIKDIDAVRRRISGTFQGHVQMQKAGSLEKQQILIENGTLSVPIIASRGETLPLQPGHSRSSTKTVAELAQAGDPEAEFKLGKRYLFGLGVTKDVVQGHRFIEKSANSGFGLAQAEMAGNASNARNFVEAYFWTTLAVENGVPNSRTLLHFLDTRMSHKQIQEANMRVVVWKKEFARKK